LLLFLVLALCHDPAGATPEAKPQMEAFDTGQQQGALANPPDVSFTISFATEKTQYQRGETIPIKLTYSSAAPNLYQYGFYGMGRIVGFEAEAPFHVDPAKGTSDPIPSAITPAA